MAPMLNSSRAPRLPLGVDRLRTAGLVALVLALAPLGSAALGAPEAADTSQVPDTVDY